MFHIKGITLKQRGSNIQGTLHSLIGSYQGCMVQGYGGSIASLIPYRNATKIFLPIFDFKKIFHTSKY
jgi:hypothetical protein